MREVSEGRRFEFGKNWARFLEVLDDERIATARSSVRELLDEESFEGKSFLDIGSGSGLFSLAARQLGARVHSIDYDQQSVACTAELRQRYFPDDPDWIITEGSVLDKEYLGSLPQYDIVYSWGVLHHTGAMWEAIANATEHVNEQGKFAVALYNHQGSRTELWTKLKRFYCSSPRPIQFLIAAWFAFWGKARPFVGKCVRLENPFVLAEGEDPKKRRGMSYWHDVVDWVGGYPFEAARPDDVFSFFKKRGFNMVVLKTDQSLGCNQFTFQRISDAGS